MITINLLRISPDSAYLEFSIECPVDFKFTKLFIKKYDMIPLNENDSLWRDCSHLYSTTTITPTRQVMRISTEALSGLTIATGASTMFYVQFGVSINTSLSNYKGTYSSGTTYAANDIVLFSGTYYKSIVSNNLGLSVGDTTKWAQIPVEEDVVSCCSDVNNVYVLLKDDLLNLNANCISPESYQALLRNYMFLYAHIEAMRLERFDEAEVFYDIIKKSFTYCTDLRSDTTRVLNSCNCG